MKSDKGGQVGIMLELATPPTAEGVSLHQLMREDLDAVFERDPSATSLWRVLLFSAGLRIVWSYRWQHWLWRHGRTTLARISHWRTRKRYACDIHPAAKIGRRFVVDHGVGVVIGETAIVGDDCLIYQGATLGMTGKSFSSEGKRHPTIGRHVLVGAGSIVLGDIMVGDNVNIGAGSVVVKPVPAHSTVVGIAAHVIGDRINCPADDSNWGPLLQTPPELERKLDEVGRRFGVTRRYGPDGRIHPVIGAKEKAFTFLSTSEDQTSLPVQKTCLSELDPSDEWCCCL